MHALNHSIWEAKAARALEFKVSVVYRIGSRTPRDTQTDPVSKKQKPAIEFIQMKYRKKKAETSE